MENRHKIEVGVAILVILCLFVLLYFLTRQKTPEPTIDDSVPIADDRPDVPPVDAEDIPAENVVSARTVVANFVERFGSYSTDADYANVEDVMSLATTDLQRRLQALAEEARQTVAESFYGVSTHALIFSMESEAELAMTWKVTTQREESIGSRENTSVRNQDIRVELVKQDGDWLVDDFAWVE